MKRWRKLAQQVEKYFDDKRDVESVQYTVGNNPAHPTAKNQSLFNVTYREDTRSTLRKRKKSVERLAFDRTQGFMELPRDGGYRRNDQLTIFVYGDELKQIQPAVTKVINVLKKK